MRIVVDASVAVQWVINEPWSEQAEDLLRGNFELLAPDHLTAEVANVLWKYVQRGQITREEALLRCKFLGNVPLELVPAAKLLQSAMTIACDHGAAVYDALYVALAHVEGISLVTVDDHLLRKLNPTPFSPTLKHIRNMAR